MALELFRLSPESKKTETLLRQHLVEVALYCKPEAQTPGEIADVVSDMLEQPGWLSEDNCNGTLSECCKTGRLLRAGAESFQLANAVIDELEARHREYQETEAAFDSGLVTAVGHKTGVIIDPLAQPLLCLAVKQTCQEIFYEGAIKLQELTKPESNLSIYLSDRPGETNTLKARLKTLSNIQSGIGLDMIVAGVKLFLSRLDDLQRRYLASLHRRVFYFQMLDIDPRIQEIEKKSLSKMRAYLDTNVVVRYVCDGVELHEPIRDILNTTKLLNINLCVSPTTLKEMASLVHEALEFSPTLKMSNVERFMKEARYGLSNPIVEGFISLRKIKARLNWEGYVAPFKKLEEYLLDNDIVLEKECFDDIELDNRYQEAYKVIASTKYEETSPNILAHDTANFVLIQRLREKYPGTPLGAAVWLLTIDRRLPLLDGKMKRVGYQYPHCQLLEQWAEMLAGFQNVRNFIPTDDYIAFLASQKLGAYIPEQKLNIHIIDALAKSEVLHEKVLTLDAELASAIISDLQKDREAKRLLEQIETATDEQKEGIEHTIIEKANESTIKQHSESITRVQQDTQALRTGLSMMTEQFHRQQTKFDEELQSLKSLKGQLKRTLRATQKQKSRLEEMSFWTRLRYLLNPRRIDT